MAHEARSGALERPRTLQRRSGSQVLRFAGVTYAALGTTRQDLSLLDLWRSICALLVCPSVVLWPGLISYHSQPSHHPNIDGRRCPSRSRSHAAPVGGKTCAELVSRHTFASIKLGRVAHICAPVHVTGLANGRQRSKRGCAASRAFREVAPPNRRHPSGDRSQMANFVLRRCS